MNIQSISIVVPTKGCVNKCKFCVSRMHESKYENEFDIIQIEKRIRYAVNNGVNTCIITGTGEALQNTKFLYNLNKVFDTLNHPFPNVELQTTGVLLVNNLQAEHFNLELLKSLRVNTISVSVSDIFDDVKNMDIIGVTEFLRFRLSELIDIIKSNRFNLRLSLNMTNAYNDISLNDLFHKLKELKADHVTFRKLWHNDDNTLEQTNWVKYNACKPITLDLISEYIQKNGKALYKLPFGYIAYSLMGMSIVIDDNCMSKNDQDKLKYVILRENGKLYCQWDDEGSLIF